ncbi:Prolyl 34-dihydroxylase TPA1 [Spathaspora sp. JA1]|nr:Prolyl 34-dihydroxylase TPA1 [Spathaspora sp. JA1]
MTKRKVDINEEDNNSKKQSIDFTKDDIYSFFGSKIWDNSFQDDLKQSIETSEPYRWGTVTELFDDTLLRQVRKEVLSEIAFTQKETDIYKVFQSGDLANLSGLDWNDLSRLPSLFKLRAGIYSQEFRDVISKVTGCGKLSGVKTDISINTYTKGCHLLTHDDVIGSRRVSFILYLPDPDRTWKESYGGGLRLYPAVIPNVPQTDFSQKLIPQFNQIAFFTVQPGLSFHDVEEVREDKQRLSIQGWFHIPQEGEDGFIPGEQEETEARSTLQQLQSKELQEYDFPKSERNNFAPSELNIYQQSFTSLTEAELTYLGHYINPIYLSSGNITKLNTSFFKDSIIEIQNVLVDDYAKGLRDQIRNLELNSVTPQKSTEVTFPWKCAVPPHKQRFMYIDGKSPIGNMNESNINYVTKIGPQELPNFSLVETKHEVDTKLVELAKLFKSVAFKKWLKLLTSLILTGDQVLIRRFRPGHDFILATTIDKSEGVLLEATLNLTPSAVNPKNWESGEFGGYELCMLHGDESDAEESDEQDDDPAVYKANDPNDDSILFTSQCKWNTLTLYIRDPSVLKFIKYVSINAKGSRWDISSQWNVQPEEEDNDNEEENN